ncbi:hypothetical protein QAD02_006495, partial [Eretmocerus hayati]
LPILEDIKDKPPFRLYVDDFFQDIRKYLPTVFLMMKADPAAIIDSNMTLNQNIGPLEIKVESIMTEGTLYGLSNVSRTENSSLNMNHGQMSSFAYVYHDQLKVHFNKYVATSLGIEDRGNMDLLFLDVKSAVSSNYTLSNFEVTNLKIYVLDVGSIQITMNSDKYIIGLDKVINVVLPSFKERCIHLMQKGIDAVAEASLQLVNEQKLLAKIPTDLLMPYEIKPVCRENQENKTTSILPRDDCDLHFKRKTV